jgi:hypothetical protein
LDLALGSSDFADDRFCVIEAPATAVLIAQLGVRDVFYGRLVYSQASNLDTYSDAHFESAVSATKPDGVGRLRGCHATSFTTVTVDGDAIPSRGHVAVKMRCLGPISR